ncbi:MAG: tripartite tricarboxylate transporter substrate binding protein [Burkholderiales bacterium]|nr:tripartite tricarboxylate transporter substrate binding protein [Burkholderiales bacterium]
MPTLHRPLIVLLGLVLAGSTFAQSWPSRPIRFIVSAPAGSSLDVIARPLGDKLKDALGQPVVVENRPAAGGTQATDAVAKSAPDGYTILLSFNGPLAFAPFLYPRLPYDPQKDLAPIVVTTTQPNLLAVSSDLQVTSIRELVAWMKPRPGKLNYASVGNGSSSHLTMEYLKLLTGTFAVHIPFNGAPPAVLSVASGDTQAIFTVPTVILPQVKAGKLRPLAVTSKARYALLPDVPTVAESGMKELAGFEAIAWNGILAPAGTPREIVVRLNAEFNKAFADPAIRQRLQAGGLEPTGGPPEAFARLMADEAAKWAPIIKRTGARID